MKYAIPLILSLATSLVWSADQVIAEPSGPVSNVSLMAPLTPEEAMKWHVYSQVVMVKEKDGVLFDTMEAKGHVQLIHSISYFKSRGGELFAIITYLRPRQAVGPFIK